ncbi:uncharacterized protein LOC133735639 [Rosa rugosa]|uniref:uncharacterized protein LOC133735639 n=1 Tax=Rosa rugosa TaxID=74645 RepID=UPI002B40763B|nr:uncharacterized protein LOC133735639 [Rosa rugosa]XP_062019018.1 uncharacterized protein LOC133735639 [Rosa rugosa]
MGTFSVRKRVRLAEECSHFEDELLLDTNYEKFLGLVQVGDENLDNFSVDQATSLHYEPNLDVPETSKKSQVTEKLRKGMIRGEMNGLEKSAVLLSTEVNEGPSNVRYALKKNRATVEKEDLRVNKSLFVMENVKLEPLDFDSGGMNQCSNKRTHLEAFNTQKPLKSAVENVNVEAPDSDSGWNRGISERCSKRPCLEASDTPKTLKSSRVKKKNKINRTSRRFLKKGKMNINIPNKSARLLPEKKTGMKKKVNVEAAHAVSGTSNVLSSKQKGSRILQSAPRRCNRGALSIHIDETYETFLNLAVMSGDIMIYTPRNGTRNIYEEDMESSSDSEETVLDNNRRDGYHPSYVKTKATTNRTLRRGVMKKKMSCPKNYEDTSSDSDLNEQDSHQHDECRASFVKNNTAINRTMRKTVSPRARRSALQNKNRKTPTGNLEVLRAKKSSVAKKKNIKETLNTVSAECDLVHESYEEFISFVEVDGKNLVYTRSNGGRKIYEEQEATSDAMHRDSLDSFHIMDTNGGHSIESHNQFREGLMKDLGRPYDQEELLKLLKDACSKGPSDHETDLFNSIESGQTPREYGKTYLEVYKDLGDKIYAANGDRSKTLNLYRGLFYWLKNKSQEGSFIPWKDKRCLKMMLPPEKK